MTKRTQVFSASLALVLLGGVLTGCSTNETAKGAARSSVSASSASPDNSSTPDSSTPATSSTNPTSQSTSTSTSSSSSSPSSSGTSRPGSSPTVKWSPPSAEEQAKAIAELTALGYHVKFDDPSSFPAKPPVPPEPSISEDALAQTELGAILTVDFYFNSIYFYLAGGADKGIKQVTATSCAECIAFSDTVDGLRSGGSFAVPPVVGVSNLRIVKQMGNGALELEGDVKFSSVNFYNPHDGKVVSTPDSSGEWTFHLAWSEVGRWTILTASPKQ